MEENMLTAQVRSEAGSGAVRRLRRAGILPAVLNGEEGATLPIQMDMHTFEGLLHHHTSENLIVDLKVGDKAPVKVLVREVQHEPVSGQILHAEFIEVSMSKRMTVNIELNFVGDPVGVTQQGGLLEELLRDVEVECLPGDLVERIDVDVSGMKLNDTLTVADLQAGPGLAILTDPAIAVASVTMPRVDMGAEAGEGEAEGAGSKEPEVIGAKRKEEEEA
jgi:large subunit ribosomal protein L25